MVYILYHQYSKKPLKLKTSSLNFIEEMGNTCKCFNEEGKDREEFQSLTTDRRQKEQHVVTIQKNFRGYKARKQY